MANKREKGCDRAVRLKFEQKRNTGNREEIEEARLGLLILLDSIVFSHFGAKKQDSHSRQSSVLEHMIQSRHLARIRIIVHSRRKERK
jgi:hypothetical protein